MARYYDYSTHNKTFHLRVLRCVEEQQRVDGVHVTRQPAEPLPRALDILLLLDIQLDVVELQLLFQRPTVQTLMTTRQLPPRSPDLRQLIVLVKYRLVNVLSVRRRILGAREYFNGLLTVLDLVHFGRGDVETCVDLLQPLVIFADAAADAFEDVQGDFLQVVQGVGDLLDGLLPPEIRLDDRNVVHLAGHGGVGMI